MLKNWAGVFAVLLSLAACAPMPVAEPQNVRIESAPGMSVIYLVRSKIDWGATPVMVYLDERWIGATHAGTYYRIEVPAGRHRITGYALDNGTITLDTEANRVYFVEQNTRSFYSRQIMGNSSYMIVDEARASTVMADAERLEALPCVGVDCSRATVQVLPLIPQPER
jgi:hypothetical protein